MVAETKHERNERTSKLGLLDGSFKSVTVDQSQSTQDSLQGCSFTANNSSNSPSYVRIESKVLCFSIDSSFLHITQIKGIKSRTISLDKDEANWLLNSFHYIKSGASWVFTRYGNSRKLQISFEKNQFGGFFRFMELKGQGKSTISEDKLISLYEKLTSN
ncbi:unnamed protein product [Cuscuta europaea]|uniref:Uncharacterized protein n=1 Tax=Cuscuta europaea TaxID=41803 RepID=A0A9P1A0X5_CUSEU|nr:unnamed protein product [Cuscuta europaea]